MKHFQCNKVEFLFFFSSISISPIRALFTFFNFFSLDSFSSNFFNSFTVFFLSLSLFLPGFEDSKEMRTLGLEFFKFVNQRIGGSVSVELYCFRVALLPFHSLYHVCVPISSVSKRAKSHFNLS